MNESKDKNYDKIRKDKLTSFFLDSTYVPMNKKQIKNLLISNYKDNYFAFQTRIIRQIFKICLDRNIKLITVNHVYHNWLTNRDSVMSIKSLFDIDIVKIEIK